MKTWMIVVVIVAVVVIGAGTFYGGMRYGENRVLKDPTALLRSMGTQGGGGFPGGADLPGRDGQLPSGQAPSGQPVQGQDGQTRGGTMGTIESIEGDVITLSTANGSVEVRTTSTTLVEMFTSVPLNELKVGESVVVSGSQGDDGTITARSIQSMRGGFGAAFTPTAGN